MHYFRLKEILLKMDQEPPAWQKDSRLPKAAVLVLLHRVHNQESLLLTKRSQEVAHHKGQICFPGGVRDEEDATLWETALRETEEEIGLPKHPISLIGQLSPLVTPSGFLVFPFVASLHESLNLKINPTEITEAFSVPLDSLFNPANLQFVRRSSSSWEALEETLSQGTASRGVPQEFLHQVKSGYDDPLFTYNNHEIWGATGRIILQLLEALRQAGWKSD